MENRAGKQKTGIISKADVSTLYSPNVSRSSAVRSLIRLIEKNPSLNEELKEAFYDKRDRLFTPRQVEIIYKHLGRP